MSVWFSVSLLKKSQNNIQPHTFLTTHTRSLLFDFSHSCFNFNNTLRCFNRIKKNNVNTLDSPAVTSKNIQKLPTIKEWNSVHITFLFFYFHNTFKCFNRLKKTNVNTLDSPVVTSKKEWKVAILLFFFSISATHWGVRIEWNKHGQHIRFATSYVKKHTKKPIVRECKSFHIIFFLFYFNNTLRCFNRIKKINVNTLDSPTVMSKTKQQKPIVK